jgi:magnesium-transporting ATPase (P-type)
MSDTDQSGTSQSSEEEHERLNREFMELLYEARTAILGVQVLFVFLLRVPFSQQYSSLSTPQVYVWYATLLCTLLSAMLLMAPTPHHRVLWREHQREERIELGNRLILAGLTFLALAILGVVFLISELVVGGVGAAVATVGVGVVFLWVWYGQPLLSMRG